MPHTASCALQNSLGEAGCTGAARASRADFITAFAAVADGATPPLRVPVVARDVVAIVGVARDHSGVVLGALRSLSGPEVAWALVHRWPPLPGDPAPAIAHTGDVVPLDAAPPFGPVVLGALRPDAAEPAAEALVDMLRRWGATAARSIALDDASPANAHSLAATVPAGARPLAPVVRDDLPLASTPTELITVGQIRAQLKPRGTVTRAVIVDGIAAAKRSEAASMIRGLTRPGVIWCLRVDAAPVYAVDPPGTPEPTDGKIASTPRGRKPLWIDPARPPAPGDGLQAALMAVCAQHGAQEISFRNDLSAPFNEVQLVVRLPFPGARHHVALSRAPFGPVGRTHDDFAGGPGRGELLAQAQRLAQALCRAVFDAEACVGLRVRFNIVDADGVDMVQGDAQPSPRQARPTDRGPADPQPVGARDAAPHAGRPPLRYATSAPAEGGVICAQLRQAAAVLGWEPAQADRADVLLLVPTGPKGPRNGSVELDVDVFLGPRDVGDNKPRRIVMVPWYDVDSLRLARECAKLAAAGDRNLVLGPARSRPDVGPTDPVELGRPRPVSDGKAADRAAAVADADAQFMAAVARCMFDADVAVRGPAPPCASVVEAAARLGAPDLGKTPGPPTFRVVGAADAWPAWLSVCGALLAAGMPSATPTDHPDLTVVVASPGLLYPAPPDRAAVLRLLTACREAAKSGCRLVVGVDSGKGAATEIKKARRDAARVHTDLTQRAPVDAVALDFLAGLPLLAQRVAPELLIGRAALSGAIAGEVAGTLAAIVARDLQPRRGRCPRCDLEDVSGAPRGYLDGHRCPGTEAATVRRRPDKAEAARLQQSDRGGTPFGDGRAVVHVRRALLTVADVGRTCRLVDSRFARPLGCGLVAVAATGPAPSPPPRGGVPGQWVKVMMGGHMPHVAIDYGDRDAADDPILYT